ncbi:MAG: Bax inhibitor-1/YccA family protein [Acutalibacteraceae bacterium]
MNYNYNSNGYQQNPYQQYEQTNGLAEYSKRVFSWMFLGLGITFIIGFVMLMNADKVIFFLAENIALYYIAALVEVVAVFILGFFVSKLSPTACKVIFLLYSVVNGFTITPALIVYGAESAFYAFAATALIFGGMTLYGMVTKKDLTKLGPVLFIGLIGLLIYSVIAMIFRMPMSDLLISIIGIVIFVGFTAYDTQKIKRYYASFSGDEVSLQKTAIIAALDLYLDFINLFLYILRLFARNNN